MELLKKINQPSDGGGMGILDALKDITDKLRAEFDDKLNDLIKKVNKIDQDFKDGD
jgi:hypothetical protein